MLHRRENCLGGEGIMPKININGITREMTADEEKVYIAEYAEEMPEAQPTAEERIAALEAALTALLEGELE